MFGRILRIASALLILLHCEGTTIKFSAFYIWIPEHLQAAPVSQALPGRHATLSLLEQGAVEETRKKSTLDVTPLIFLVGKTLKPPFPCTPQCIRMGEYQHNFVFRCQTLCILPFRNSNVSGNLLCIFRGQKTENKIARR